MPKTILIAGDLIWDYNLVKSGDISGTYSEPFDKTVLSVTPGGAWFLKRLVEESVRDRKADTAVLLGWPSRC